MKMENNEVKKASFGWAVLGFFFPLVGLILFILWNKPEPEKAKMSGIGALVGAVCKLFLPFILLFIFFYLLGSDRLDSFINKMNCLDYGTNYKPVEIDGEWYCKNSINGKIVDPYENIKDCENGDCYIPNDYDLEDNYSETKPGNYEEIYDDELDEYYSSETQNY